MRKIITEYIKNLENNLNKNVHFTKEDINNIKEKISYFQHERLIHLLVTLAYAIFTIIFMVLGVLSYIFLIPFAIGIVFLIFYIRHYFFLEHSVQYLYKLKDKVTIRNKCNERRKNNAK